MASRRSWIRPRWGAVRLSAVTHEAAQTWLAGIDRAPATVRKIHRTTYRVTTIAGYAASAGNADGTGPAALFNNPTGIAIISNVLYAADYSSNKIRKIQ